ncbi:hypothetical protein [Flavobacterium sp.]|uniref:hypothetical protein n=1 Tax=Flavobacterium sp. TaxID=239 RepID=UPI003D6C4176
MKKIQVGFLVSYDYDLLKNAIPQVYKEADTIFLAIDKDRKTWNGGSFVIEDEFFQWIKETDTDHKIEIYEDNFYRPELTTMDCEVRERKMLSEKMGIGNWLIQIDADEYFLDFAAFIKDLRKYDSYLDNPSENPIQIGCFLTHLYKYTDDGILYVENLTRVLLATNYPNYKVGRKSKERVIYTDKILLHECLSRTEEQLAFKLENWGHNVQINNSFFDKWKSVNQDNYKEMEDFYYIEPETWKTLGYMPTKNIGEMQRFVSSSKALKISKSFLLSKNFGQWFKFLFK